MSKKIHVADSESFQLIDASVQQIFAKRLSTGQFQIRAETESKAFETEFWKPLLHRTQTSVAHNRRARSGAIISKSSGRVMLQPDRETEELAQPTINHE